MLHKKKNYISNAFHEIHVALQNKIRFSHITPAI